MDKRKNSFYIFMLCLIVVVFFNGTCDFTPLRGKIIVGPQSVNVGEDIRLDLQIPQELDDIHRIQWGVDPEDAGEIKYKEYPVQWGEQKYGKEDRIAFFTAKKPGACEIYALGFYKQTNPQLIDKITVQVLGKEGNSARGESTFCRNYTSGVLTPLKDHRTIYDDQYTEVTMTSSQVWEKSKLPKEVPALMEQGYDCLPSPDKMKYPDQEGDVLIQPEVLSVRWECELGYSVHKYLGSRQKEEKRSLEARGFDCEKTPCLDNEHQGTYVWSCFK